MRKGSLAPRLRQASALPPTARGKTSRFYVFIFYVKQALSDELVCVTGLSRVRLPMNWASATGTALPPLQHHIPVPSTTFVPNWPHTKLMTCIVVPAVSSPRLSTVMSHRAQCVPITPTAFSDHRNLTCILPFYQMFLHHTFSCSSLCVRPGELGRKSPSNSRMTMCWDLGEKWDFWLCLAWMEECMDRWMRCPNKATAFLIVSHVKTVMLA